MAGTPSNTRDRERRRAWRFLPFAAILAALALGYALGLHERLSLDALGDSREALKAIVAKHPALAPAGFMLAYAIAVACLFPAPSLLTVFSGFLFGWLAGALYAIIAATTGATVVFLATRTAFAGFLRRRAGPWGEKLADGFEQGAFGYLLVLRIAPFIPFTVVNIAPGLFNVRLRTFLAATLIGILPGAFSYAWLGRGVDSVITAARAAGRDARLADLVTPDITIAFIALTLVATLAALVRRVWAARNHTTRPSP